MLTCAHMYTWVPSASWQASFMGGWVLQDASRLLDLCRQSVVFESSADLAACLAAIRVDSDVFVVRIKNRLDPHLLPHSDGSRCDSEPVAGYRDVAVNLRIKSPAAVSLGLDDHICELQLLLRSFAELKVKLFLYTSRIHPISYPFLLWSAFTLEDVPYPSFLLELGYGCCRQFMCRT